MAIVSWILTCRPLLMVYLCSVPEEVVEESKPRSAPVFVSKPEPCTVEEGEWARFCCRVTGHPRPRVMWLINGHTVVNGSRYKLTYDGMYHMDIPKTRQYDTGKVEVIARSSVGEAIAETELKVIPRHDDYRGVLKNSPRRKFYTLTTGMNIHFLQNAHAYRKYCTPLKSKNAFNTAYSSTLISLNSLCPILLLKATEKFAAEVFGCKSWTQQVCRSVFSVMSRVLCAFYVCSN